MKRAIFGLVVVIGLLHSAESEACSCAVPDRVAPVDGTTGVALSAKIIVNSSRVTVLRLENGTVVPTTREQLSSPNLWDVARLIPTTSLQSNTRYEVLLDGSVVSTFETGTAEDIEAPAAPTLTGFSAETADVVCPTSCLSNYRRVELLANFGAGVEYLQVILRPETGRSTEYHMFPEDLSSLHSVGTSLCPAGPPLFDPGSQLCLELRAIDLSGNSSPIVSRCVSVAACAPIEKCPLASAATDGSACLPVEPSSAGTGCSLSTARMASRTGTAAAFAMLALGMLWFRRRCR